MSAPLPFTVLLLYPDYIADAYGQETYLAHVVAADPAAAVLSAQREVAIDLRGTDDAVDEEDFFPLAVFAGIHDDINPDPHAASHAAKKG